MRVCCATPPLPLCCSCVQRQPSSPFAAPKPPLHFCAAQTGQVGMVLDLSNSTRYYDPQEIVGNSVRYVKV